MKVIKNGKLVKQVTCSYCECVYEYNGKDVKIEYDFCNIPSCCITAGRRYVQCPQCNEVYYLKKPNEVEENA